MEPLPTISILAVLHTLLWNLGWGAQGGPSSSGDVLVTDNVISVGAAIEVGGIIVRMMFTARHTNWEVTVMVTDEEGNGYQGSAASLEKFEVLLKSCDLDGVGFIDDFEIQTEAANTTSHPSKLLGWGYGADNFNWLTQVAKA